MGCDHRNGPLASPRSTLEGYTGDHVKLATGGMPYRDICAKCGARRIDSQLGLESTPQAYVERLVAIFREVRRVLRKDGCLFLNLGDSYNGSGGPGSQYDSKATGGYKGEFQKYDNPNRKVNGLKPKDLIGIPWMAAFALRDDGWWLRSDIIWHKPNPMPESVTDRVTRAHEYVFLLTKSRQYFYDSTAIAEPSAASTLARVGLADSRRDAPPAYGSYKAGEGRGQSRGQHADHLVLGSTNGRNKRSVWTIPTQAYQGAHFATYPEALVEPCILAGTSERGCCPKCGSPWEQQWVYAEKPKNTGHGHEAWLKHVEEGRLGGLGGTSATRPIGSVGMATRKIVTGWVPTCDCDAGEPVPCTVLDPFSGAGTTGVVAVRHGRCYIGIDLNGSYNEMAERRIAKEQEKIALKQQQLSLSLEEGE